jgi:nucleoside-diphosphate-sugar epimerase
MELNSCESIIDYLYITDFVKGLEKIIDYRLCGIYNICSGTQLKVKDIIDTIQQLTGSKNKITYNKALNRDNFPTYICGSSTKLQTLIDWKPTTTIIAGLTATIQHFK